MLEHLRVTAPGGTLHGSLCKRIAGKLLGHEEKMCIVTGFRKGAAVPRFLPSGIM